MIRNEWDCGKLMAMHIEHLYMLGEGMISLNGYFSFDSNLFQHSKHAIPNLGVLQWCVACLKHSIKNLRLRSHHWGIYSNKVTQDLYLVTTICNNQFVLDRWPMRSKISSWEFKSTKIFEAAWMGHHMWTIYLNQFINYSEFEILGHRDLDRMNDWSTAFCRWGDL